MERFWSKVNKTDTCWLWTASKDSSGYGKFYLNKVQIPAHRFSYYLHHGKYPDNLACHTCNIKICVRPDHLYDGTIADNIRDIIKTGNHRTQQPGFATKTKSVRLNEKLVIELRTLYDSGKYTKYQLAKMFSLNSSTVGRAVDRKSWTHIWHCGVP